jgi:putative cardiolipin synthase
MDARAKNTGFAALHAHPHIDVRMFNPFASRDGFFAFIFEGIGSFNRINRRMHNKSWIADNRIAMVGGRNLGDEYFGASQGVNFEDLDFAMAGPVVQDVSASFDLFWNAVQTYPIDVLDPDSVSEENLLKLRETLAAASAEAASGWYAEALRGDDAIKRLFGGDWTLEWSGNYQFGRMISEGDRYPWRGCFRGPKYCFRNAQGHIGIVCHYLTCAGEKVRTHSSA